MPSRPSPSSRFASRRYRLHLRDQALHQHAQASIASDTPHHQR
ncbi:hypothetical protein [Lysobacter gummosus]